MKKLFVVLMLTFTTLPAFAQRYGTCQVAAVDRYNRIIARFYGYPEGPNGICRQALRQCNYEVRMRGWYDARCIQYRARW